MESLHPEETELWWRYMAERGSLSVTHQLEVSVARIMSFLASMHGAKNVAPADFMPRRLAQESNAADEMTIEQMIASGGR